MDKISLSVFFPAFNEEDNIRETVQKTDATVREIAKEYEIIVVDDGSLDKTALIVEELIKKYPNLRLIKHNKNQGYGAALWSGIKTARYDWVFFTDADLQFDISELKKLVQCVPMYDVVIGYRAPRRDPFMRLVNAKVWNILNRVLFGLVIRDIDCAFKLFRRDLVANLSLESRGAMISAEMLIRLQRKGVTIKEIPVTHLPRHAGSPTGAKPAVIIRAVREMIRLYRGSLGRSDNTFEQLVKFGSVGVINTGVDVVAYYFLTRFTPYFDQHILAAKFSSFIIGSICSFILNRQFTFEVKTRFRVSELARFYSSVILNVVMNVFLLYFFNSLLHIYDLIAVGLSTVVTFVCGFTFSKLWVFNKKVADADIQSESFSEVKRVQESLV